MATNLTPTNRNRSTRLPGNGRHGIRTRRLAVERIEDRLLLSAVLQTAIETQLQGSSATVDPSIIIVTPPTHGDWTDWSGGAITSGVHGPFWRELPNGVFVYDPALHLSPSSIAPTLSPIVGGDLPGNKLADTIDVGPAAAKQLVATVASPATQPVATPNANSVRASVDAVSGRCQAFELAVASLRSSDLHVENGKEAYDVAASKKGSLPSSDGGFAVNGASQRCLLGEVHMSAGRATAHSIAVSLVSTAENARTEQAAACLVLSDQRTPSSPPREAVFAAPLPATVAPQPAIESGCADVARQVVFAQIAEDADRGDAVPVYPLDTRQTAAIAVAVVSLVGSRLAERRGTEDNLCPSYLLPPRRNSPAEG